MFNDLDNAVLFDFHMGMKKSKGLNKLVKDLFDQFPEKPPQQTYSQKLRNCLRIVLINLNSTDGYISYRRGKHAKEYKTKKYSASNISKAVDFLSSHGFVENKRGYFFKKEENWNPSQMRCLPKLRKLFYEYGIKQHEIIIKPKNNIIILRDEDRNDIPFADTDPVKSKRDNLKKFNEFLSEHRIIQSNDFTVHHKSMHRVFNIDFKQGGRFYGDRWRQMSLNERLSLKIDDFPVVECDFDAFHPTILYALNGIQYNGDPYELRQYSTECRAISKKALLMFMNTGDPETTRKSIQWEINKKKLKKPAELSNLKTFIDALVDKHEAIKNHFNKSLGLRLQRLDSDICDDIHMHFYRRGIPVLSVHDSFIIPTEFEKKLKKEMEEAFYNKFKKICHASKKARKKT
jgi:hypothetical protein